MPILMTASRLTMLGIVMVLYDFVPDMDCMVFRVYLGK